MVDLFPPPQDRNAGHDSARSAPRHDPVPQHGEDADGPRIWPFPHHLAEAGVQGVAADNLFGFVAPKGTPPEAVQTIARALQKVLAQPDLKSALAQQGAELHYTSAEDFRKAIAQEREVWGGVVKEFNVQPQ